MKEFVQYTLYFHAFCGASALLFGILAILTKKGSKKHILSGQIYFYSMLLVAITGLIVATYRNTIFLQTIAFFAFYMAFTGKRVLKNKKEIIVTKLDWIANIVSMGVGAYMLYLGITNLFRSGFVGAIPMLLVFGGLLFWMTLQDALKMKNKKWVKNDWLYTHIGRMGGSFIATSTAFLLINISFEPRWVVWLAPTFIGTPLMIASIKKWKVKLVDKKEKNIA